MWAAKLPRAPAPSRRWLYLAQCRKPTLILKHNQSTAAAPSSVLSLSNTSNVTIDGTTYPTDSWFNTPPSIVSKIGRQLHLQPDHPISITRQIIERAFATTLSSSSSATGTAVHYNDLPPVVSTHQNFDSLGFPADHPGRNKSDTYYLNATTLLRTHTSAHQADVFRKNVSGAFSIAADVYRRDEIDSSHYPVFHQMEGARSWDRNTVAGGDIAAQVRRDTLSLPRCDGVVVEQPVPPPFHDERNPIQGFHSPEEAEALAEHLQRSLELTVVDLFKRARMADQGSGNGGIPEKLQLRWEESTFPFTSPSYELFVHWQGQSLEVLGCGIVKQEIYDTAGLPSQLGWAFGLGLDRLAMLLFGIPDIRLFWSQDERFLSQFRGVKAGTEALKRYKPFSKFPGCYKDVSFWLPQTGEGGDGFHVNDVMEVVRDVAGDTVEDVKLVDEFENRKTGQRSLCWRVVYRSLERTLTNVEVNELNERVRGELVRRLGVVLR